MSILIKGFDMPSKPTQIKIYPNGIIFCADKDGIYVPKAQAIQIPTPHGRLIDGDALREKFEDRCAGECGICEEEIIPDGGCKLIVNAPTILDKERE